MSRLQLVYCTLRKNELTVTAEYVKHLLLDQLNLYTPTPPYAFYTDRVVSLLLDSELKNSF